MLNNRGLNALFFAAMLCASFFLFTLTAKAATLKVDYIEQAQTAAIADNTWANGWQWKFYVTIPSPETVFKMKFGDLTGEAKTIGAADNIRYYSDQSLNAASSSPINISAANTYGAAMNLNTALDIDSAKPDRQIIVTIEVKVPVDAAAGSYAGSYGINSEAPALFSTVVSVPALNSNMALGTPRENLFLPSHAQVLLSDGRTISALIFNWSAGSPDYNNDLPGVYPFFGALVLPSGISNPLNLKVVLNFIVSGSSPAPSLSRIAITPSSWYVLEGDRKTFSASGFDQFGNPFALSGVSWSSDHPEFATVDQNGLVTAVSPGEANIICRAGAITASSIVTVTPFLGDPDDATLKSLVINYSSIFYGNTVFPLSLTLFPGDYAYAVGLIPGTNAASLAAEANTPGATVNIFNPASLPGLGSIEVISRNGLTRNVYTVDIQVQGR